MSRKIRKIDKQGSYHITARANDQKWFGIEMSELWELYSEYLYFLNIGFGVKIHNFVLMSNHFHLQASFPDDNLSTSMCYFMTNTSKCINSMRGSINHVYGSRFHSSLIQTPYHYANVYKYVARNPIKKNLGQSVENYPWSTLNGVFGKRRIIIPVTDHMHGLDEMIYKNNSINLGWLNIPTEPELDDAIKKGLKKKVFRLSKVDGTGKTSALDSLLY